MPGTFRGKRLDTACTKLYPLPSILYPLSSILYPLPSKTLIKRQIELLFKSGEGRVDFEEEVVFFL